MMPLKWGGMSKHQRDLKKIDEYRERFRDLSIEQIEKRLSFDSLVKEAAIALKQLLKEKE